MLPEDDVDYLQDDELAEEQDPPHSEDAQSPAESALSLPKIGCNPVFKPTQCVEQRLEQHRGQYRDSERVDDDRIGVLHKEVQHHDVNENVGHPIGEPLLVSGDRDRLRLFVRHEALLDSAP